MGFPYREVPQSVFCPRLYFQVVYGGLASCPVGNPALVPALFKATASLGVPNERRLKHPRITHTPSHTHSSPTHRPHCPPYPHHSAQIRVSGVQTTRRIQIVLPCGTWSLFVAVKMSYSTRARYARFAAGWWCCGYCLWRRRGETAGFRPSISMNHWVVLETACTVPSL